MVGWAVVILIVFVEELRGPVIVEGWGKFYKNFTLLAQIVPGSIRLFKVQKKSRKKHRNVT